MKSLSAQDILFEDNHLIAINKPAGVLVQGDNTGDVALDALAKEFLKKGTMASNTFSSTGVVAL